MKIDKVIYKRLRTLIFILVLPLLMIFLYLDINERIKENKIENQILQGKIVVENNTKFDLENITKIVLHNILCHDSIFIRFDYMDEQLYVSGLKIEAYLIKNPLFQKQYIIYLSKDIREYSKDVILIHELMHLHQYEIGDLVLLNPYLGTYLYKNDTIDIKKTFYSERPYEIDANNAEDSIYFLLQEELKTQSHTK